MHDDLDDYDRRLIGDTDYNRPMYNADPQTGDGLAEGVAAASAIYGLGNWPSHPSERETFLFDLVFSSLVAFRDLTWMDLEGKP